MSCGYWILNNIGSIFIPIFIFFLGYIVKVFNAKKLKQTDLKRHRTMLQTWYNGIKPAFKDQQDSIEALSLRVSKNDDLNSVPYQKVIIPYKCLDSLSLVKLYDIFIYNSTIPQAEQEIAAQHIFNIVSTIEFLEQNQILFEKQYLYYSDNLRDLMKDWNENMNQIHDLVNSHKAGTNPTPIETQFAAEVFDAFKETEKANIENGNIPSISIYEDHFILPILTKFTNDQHKYATSSFIAKVISANKNLLQLVLQFKTYKKTYPIVFQQIKDENQKAIDKMDAAFKYFASKPIPNVWNIKP